jgi:small subunit ribosomal protein S3
MTHVVHPYAHRLGIIRDWKSRWFGTKDTYRKFLKSDVLIRQYLEKKLRGFFVADIQMERSEKAMHIIIETSRPGMIIGRNGEGSIKLKEDLDKFIAKNKLVTGGEVKIDVREVRSPESNSMIVAQMMAEGLEKRLPFRRVGKQMMEKVMANRDVLGVKIEMSGRLGGASMARQEKMKKGRIPLQTLRADVDFTKYEARMPYGAIGIKVWIYKGDIFEKDRNSKK